MKKVRRILTAFFLAPILFFPLLKAEEATAAISSPAHLRYVSGGVYIQRTADMAYEKGSVNTAVKEGDRLGTTDGRADLQISGGKYIRLDHNTKIDLLELPGRLSGRTRIRVLTGHCYLRINSIKEGKKIEILSSDVSLFVLDKGLFRIDVRASRETEIFVYNGLLEAALENGSKLIKKEQRLEVIGGHSTSQPTGFLFSTEDSFDRWNGQRDRSLKRRPAQRFNSEKQYRIPSDRNRSKTAAGKIPKNRIYPPSLYIHSTRRGIHRPPLDSYSSLARLAEALSGEQSSYIIKKGFFRRLARDDAFQWNHSGLGRRYSRPPIMRAPSSHSPTRSKESPRKIKKNKK